MRKRVQLIDRARGALRLGRAVRLVWDSAPRWTIASLGLVVLQGVVPLVSLYLLKLIIDEVTAALAAPDPSVAANRVALLVGLAAGTSLLGAILRTAAGLVGEVQSLLVTDHVYGVIHQKSAEVDLAFYEDPAYQDSLHRTQQEAPTRPTQVLNALSLLVRSGVTLVGILMLLVAVSGWLVIALFVALVPGLWSRVRFSNLTYEWMRKTASVERQAGYFGMLLTSPSYAREVSIWGLSPILVARFRELRNRLRRERLRISRSRAVADVVAQTAALVAVFGAFVFLAQQTLVGALTIGALVMYFQAIQKAQSLFTEVLGGLAALYEHNLFLSHLDEFLALTSRVSVPETPMAFPRPLRSGVEVENVTFKYPASRAMALSGVDLSVRRGEMIAIVGSNGSGKTTLIKLMCRLYDPTSGKIMVDGIDVRNFDPVQLRRQIGVVFQDHLLFAVSIKENIAYGNSGRPIDDTRVKRAAKQAGIDSVIRKLPLGYDTPLFKLFEGGQELSGGERQKIALARAFYSDAQLLILDEPSSALDPQAEVDLFSQIREEASDRAAIVISHRFSTVRMADRIYVLDEGAVTEGGTHEELMRLEGTYARLFELQAAQYRSGSTPLLALGAGKRVEPDSSISVVQTAGVFSPGSEP